MSVAKRRSGLPQRGTTSGEERFKQADALARSGRTEEAIALFQSQCDECRTSWVEREARKRIEKLRARWQQWPWPPLAAAR
jgi:hypothetical protein